MNRFVGAAVCAAMVAFTPHVAAALPAVSGTWSIAPSHRSGDVRLELRSDSDGHDNDSSLDLAPQELGLSDAQLRDGGGHVTFTFAREAGSFACEGRLGNGTGAGTFVFSPSSAYVAAMSARGYTLDGHQLMTAAMLDLTTAYVGAVAAAGYEHLSFDKLVAFRALGIDGAYIRSTVSSFGKPIDADKLVALRALGVDAAYIKRVEAHGFPNLTVDQLISLKALNVI